LNGEELAYLDVKSLVQHLHFNASVLIDSAKAVPDGALGVVSPD
jgi:hypothetical protein